MLTVAPRSSILMAILAVLIVTSSGVAYAFPMDFSFHGSFAADNSFQLFAFTADGASVVTLRTYSYAGGVQSDGTVVSAGGFDPILALFDSSGFLIGGNDDGINVPVDPTTLQAYDTEFSQLLAAGSYTVAISQYDNFAAGPSLTDGFTQSGDPTFTSASGCSNGQFCDINGNNRSNSWAFDVLNVDQAAVPEPSSGLLLAIGLFGICARRYGPMKTRSRSNRPH